MLILKNKVTNKRILQMNKGLHFTKIWVVNSYQLEPEMWYHFLNKHAKYSICA